jgi:hypothetical protein
VTARATCSIAAPLNVRTMCLDERDRLVVREVARLERQARIVPACALLTTTKQRTTRALRLAEVLGRGATIRDAVRPRPSTELTARKLEALTPGGRDGGRDLTGGTRTTSALRTTEEQPDRAAWAGVFGPNQVGESVHLPRNLMHAYVKRLLDQNPHLVGERPALDRPLTADALLSSSGARNDDVVCPPTRFARRER